MRITKWDIVFALSLLFAVWFAFTGMVWVYAAALFIAYPFGLLSFALWYVGKRNDPKKKRYGIIGWILSISTVVSLVILVLLLMFDQ